MLFAFTMEPLIMELSHRHCLWDRLELLSRRRLQPFPRSLPLHTMKMLRSCLIFASLRGWCRFFFCWKSRSLRTFRELLLSLIILLLCTAVLLEFLSSKTRGRLTIKTVLPTSFPTTLPSCPRRSNRSMSTQASLVGSWAL